MGKNRKYRRGITLDSGRFYRVRVSWEGKQWHVGSYETEEHAEIALDVARGQIAAGTFVPLAIRRKQRKVDEAQNLADRLSVQEWSERWIELLRIADRSEGTIVSYQSALRVHVLPLIGPKRLIDVNRLDVEQILGEVETPGARQNAYRTMRAMFQSAVRSPDVPLKVSPVQDAAYVSPKKRRSAGIAQSKVLEESDLEAITLAMPKRLQIAVTLAGWCALRLGEVLGLQRQDFADLDDPDKATVTVQRQWHSKLSPPGYAPPKADSYRTISIPPRIVPSIVAHLDQYVDDGPESPVLPSPQDPHRPIAQTVFDRHWRTARDKVREGFKFHDLRHTGLTKYAQAGATVAELMHRAGHKDEKTAMLYQHATLERDRANVAKM